MLCRNSNVDLTTPAAKAQVVWLLYLVPRSNLVIQLLVPRFATTVMSMKITRKGVLLLGLAALVAIAAVVVSAGVRYTVAFFDDPPELIRHETVPGDVSDVGAE
jgi:hypothetical protein